ncbi:MAG: fatty acid desaturase, partial [Proteobacteria bacterium]|nr:fatty acid desaturase [Pseudomonadota bacterium]
YIHHVGMHHAESNMWDDTSSTLTYERDNIFHFLQYWLRFLLIGMLDLLAYNYKKGRMKLFRMLILVEGGYIAAVAGLFWLNPKATFVVFLVPVFVMRFAMMSGNWGQHALVCSEEPNNEYRKSVNLLHARHNRRCFNDGYHIVHHIYPTMHFTEMPASFEDNIETYVENKAIVFSGIMGNQMIWKFLMMRDYDSLAKHYVHLGGPKKSHEEVVALLKSRTRPIPRPAGY